jgi:hypothetical protein
MQEKNTFSIEIVRRPWYEWALWAIWLALVVFMAQNALASGAENEPQAATIFWGLSALLLIGGAIVWFMRRRRLTA